MNQNPSMPIKRWLIQFAWQMPLLALILGGLQYLRGRGPDYSIEFGLIWGTLSAAIYLATRIYYFRKGMYCKVCKDIDQPLGD